MIWSMYHIYTYAHAGPTPDHIPELMLQWAVNLKAHFSLEKSITQLAFVWLFLVPHDFSRCHPELRISASPDWIVRTSLHNHITDRVQNLVPYFSKGSPWLVLCGKSRNVWQNGLSICSLQLYTPCVECKNKAVILNHNISSENVPEGRLEFPA